MGRAYLYFNNRLTLRKSCINPVIGLVFQILIAYKKSNFMLLLYSLPLIIGPFIGAICAYYAFTKFYKPLL